LLLNLLLPAGLSIGIALVGDRGAAGSSVCGTAGARDDPGKANPALFVHHCAVCAVPPALPPLRAGARAYAVRIAEVAYPAVRPGLTPSPFRHGPVQARAPPLAS
jgi:hypothetical protein